MSLVSSDAGALSAARISASGQYLLYLNVTPRQGAESRATGWSSGSITSEKRKPRQYGS